MKLHVMNELVSTKCMTWSGMPLGGSQRHQHVFMSFQVHEMVANRRPRHSSNTMELEGGNCCGPHHDQKGRPWIMTAQAKSMT